jgi:hypothetical protein
MKRANHIEIDGREIGELLVHQSPPQTGVFAFVGSDPGQALEFAARESERSRTIDFGEIGIETIGNPSEDLSEDHRSVGELPSSREGRGFDLGGWRGENRIPVHLVGFPPGVEDGSGIRGDFEGAGDRPDHHGIDDPRNRVLLGVGVDPSSPSGGRLGISRGKNRNGGVDGFDDPDIRCRGAFEVDGLGGASCDRDEQDHPTP